MDREPQRGDVIAGRFRIIEELGSGTWSTIYRAYQIDRDQDVALKLLNRASYKDATLAERFRREALFISQLSHPNTVRIFDYGESSSGVLYIVMEVLEGETLGDRLTSRGRMEPDVAKDVLMQMCRSLAEVHRLAVVHRDLKPDNVFLCAPNSAGERRWVKVLDFGIAKALGPMQGVSVGRGDAALTTRGQILGTPLYMAPEQVMERELTPATDVYALGHILYEMLTGAAAFDDGLSNPARVALRHVNEDLPPLPGELARHPLAAVLRRATARQPLDRFPDAQALLDFLELLPSTKPQRAFAQRAAPRASSSTLRRTLLSAPPQQRDAEVLRALEQASTRARVMLPERDGALRDLERHVLEVMAERKSRLVLVEGDIGVGKRTLLRRWADELSIEDEDGLCVIQTRGGSDARANAVVAVHDALLEACANANPTPHDHTLSPSAHRTMRTLDLGDIDARRRRLKALRSQSGEVPTVPLSYLRHQWLDLQAALLDPLVRLAQNRLVVWCIDDLEGAHAGLTGALQTLMSRLDEVKARLVVLVGIDPDRVESRWGQVQTLTGAASSPKSAAVRVELEPLDAEQIELLLGRLGPWARSGPTRDEAEALQRWTGGHPAFVVEAWRALQETDMGGFTTQRRDALSVEGLQSRLEGLLEARLRRDRARCTSGTLLVAALRAVALLGPIASEATLRGFVREIGDEALEGALERVLAEAMELGWVKREASGALALRVRAMRETLLDAMTHTAVSVGATGEYTALRLAQAAAFVMGQHPEAEGAVLEHAASLYLRADSGTEAGRLMRDAADRAWGRFDLETAQDRYLRSLRYGQSPMYTSAADVGSLYPIQDPRDIVVYLRVGEIGAVLGDIGRAEDYVIHALRCAQTLARTRMSRAVRGRALQLRATLKRQRGETARALELIAEGRRSFEQLGSDRGIAQCLLEEALGKLALGDHERALEHGLEGLVQGELIESATVQACALQVLAQVRMRRAELTQASQDAVQASALFAKRGRSLDAAHAQQALGLIQLLEGRFDAASTSLEACLARYAQRGQRRVQLEASALKALAYGAQNRLQAMDEALTSLHKLYAQSRDQGRAVMAQSLRLDVAQHKARLSGNTTAADPDSLSRQYAALVSMVGNLDEGRLRVRLLARQARVWGQRANWAEVDTLLAQDAERDSPGAGRERAVWVVWWSRSGDAARRDGLIEAIAHATEAGDGEARMLGELLLAQHRFTSGDADAAALELWQLGTDALCTGDLRRALLLRVAAILRPGAAPNSALLCASQVTLPLPAP